MVSLSKLNILILELQYLLNEALKSISEIYEDYDKYHLLRLFLLKIVYLMQYLLLNDKKLISVCVYYAFFYIRTLCSITLFCLQ